MFIYRFDKRIAKACALVAVTLILPALAYAGNQDGNSQGGVPLVPEANAGWVLVPFVGAVLLFSARQLFRAKT